MKTVARIWRLITIILMGLTAAMTLLSAIGTTCVAFGAEKYESMAALVPYKWLYQLFVITTLAVALAAIAMTVGLMRARQKAYPGALITLLAGIIVAAAHVYASNVLRGSAAPANVRLYLSVLTLGALLLLRLPGVWQHIGPAGGGRDYPSTAAGLTAMAAGMATLTTPLWAGPTHLLDGVQWVNALLAPLLVGGGALVIAGMCLLAARHGHLQRASARAKTLRDHQARSMA